ncbi:HPP family protein [Plantactinospora siamensis]|uniref:HPP family protein n=1 Tax=Plantactinospora siamensis TaxID=555372 RepID=A0ABV6P2B0_9ACTN
MTTTDRTHRQNGAAGAAKIAGDEASAVDPADRGVTEVMSTPVLTVRSGLLLGEALHAMVRGGRRHLVVVDDTERCVGVLADRTVAAVWAYDPSALARRVVGSVLEAAPPVLAADQRLVDAARLMRTAGVDAVAVVDAAGRPVGVVTGGDLVAVLAGR